MGRRIVFTDHQQKLRERGTDLEMPDGTVFHIDPPQLWPDTVDEAPSELETCKILLGGDERYNAFVAAGGNYRMIVALVNDGFEATIPES